uniref:Uncharacterized protein n=1 Tax=Anopheles epiroticus TaxID=199890 RepID=A0A182PUN5_9DIPT
MELEPQVFAKLAPDEKDQCKLVNISSMDQVQTLGVYWDPELFDPLGIIVPVIVWAKIMMQRLWIATKEWADPIPQHLAEQWELFKEQLCHIKKIRVPRRVMWTERVTTQMYCFADASEQAYGACVYLRTTDRNGRVKVVLLATKSKVAPLKKISLPRLEFCVAVSYFWSDSTIVLNWLRAPSYTWTTFVGNRVATVQDLTHGQHWRHVKGSENPEDIVSRGALPNQLAETWFSGPTWLSNDVCTWSFPENPYNIDEALMERKRQVLLTASLAEHPVLDRYSFYWKCGRVVVLCKRFSQRCRKKTVADGPITYGEFCFAIRRLVSSLQRFEFPDEMEELAEKGVLHSSSKLRKLRPFLDQEGVKRG